MIYNYCILVYFYYLKKTKGELVYKISIQFDCNNVFWGVVQRSYIHSFINLVKIASKIIDQKINGNLFNNTLSGKLAAFLMFILFFILAIFQIYAAAILIVKIFVSTPIPTDNYSLYFFSQLDHYLFYDAGTSTDFTIMIKDGQLAAFYICH